MVRFNHQIIKVKGIFPTQGWNLRLLHLLHCRQILLPVSHQESPSYKQSPSSQEVDNQNRTITREEFLKSFKKLCPPFKWLQAGIVLEVNYFKLSKNKNYLILKDIFLRKEKDKRLNSFWESSQFLKSKSDYMKSVNNFTMNIDENFFKFKRQIWYSLITFNIKIYDSQEISKLEGPLPWNSYK